MHANLLNFTHSISAEFIKLKRTPLLWIAIIGGLFVAGFVFLIYAFNAKELVKEGQNPWNMYFEIGFAMISMLLAVPYVILVTSSITHFEHTSNAWKYLYALPLRKGNFYFSKLLVVNLLIVLTYIIFIFSIIFTGYALDFIHPAYQFQQNALDFERFITLSAHSYLSLLGVTALHYWFSMRWKNFIIPIGIGLLGFIIALFILVYKKFELAIYFPYAYSGIISFEVDTKSNPTGIPYFIGLLQSEWYSLGCFILFTVIGFWEEKTSNVK